MKASELDKKVSDFYDALIAECRPMSYGIAYEAGYRAALEDVMREGELDSDADGTLGVVLEGLRMICTIEVSDDGKE